MIVQSITCQGGPPPGPYYWQYYDERSGDALFSRLFGARDICEGNAKKWGKRLGVPVQLYDEVPRL